MRRLACAGQMWPQISAVCEDMLREQIAEVLNANKPAWIAGLNLDRRAALLPDEMLSVPVLHRAPCSTRRPACHKQSAARALTINGQVALHVKCRVMHVACFRGTSSKRRVVPQFFPRNRHFCS